MMENTEKRKDIFRSVMMRSIYAIGEAHEFFLRNCNDIWRAKYLNRPYLYEYEDYNNSPKKIDISVHDVYDIQSLATHNDPVKVISNRKGDE